MRSRYFLYQIMASLKNGDKTLFLLLLAMCPDQSLSLANFFIRSAFGLGYGMTMTTGIVLPSSMFCPSPVLATAYSMLLYLYIL